MFGSNLFRWQSPTVPSGSQRSREVGPFRMPIPLSQQATSDGSTQKIPARAFTTERQVAVIDDSASDDGIELDVGYAMAGWPRCSTMPQSTSHTTSTQLLSTTGQVQLVAVQCRSLPLVPGRPRLLRLASPVFFFFSSDYCPAALRMLEGLVQTKLASSRSRCRSKDKGGKSARAKCSKGIAIEEMPTLRDVRAERVSIVRPRLGSLGIERNCSFDV